MVALSTETLEVLDWELYLFTELSVNTFRASQVFPLCLKGLSAPARSTVMAAVCVIWVLKKSSLNRNKPSNEAAFLFDNEWCDFNVASVDILLLLVPLILVFRNRDGKSFDELFNCS